MFPTKTHLQQIFRIWLLTRFFRISQYGFPLFKVCSRHPCFLLPQDGTGRAISLAAINNKSHLWLRDVPWAPFCRKNSTLFSRANIKLGNSTKLVRFEFCFSKYCRPVRYLLLPTRLVEKPNSKLDLPWKLYFWRNQSSDIQIKTSGNKTFKRHHLSSNLFAENSSEVVLLLQTPILWTLFKLVLLTSAKLS